jgi:hypothetical protein
MAFTYDPTTARGKVRLLIQDTVSASAVFTDADIDAFLELAGGNAYAGAALACRSLAASYAKLAKSVTAGKYAETTGDAAKYLLELAKTLSESAQSGIEPAEATAETAETLFSEREFLEKDSLRNDA